MADTIRMWHPDVPHTKKTPVTRPRTQFDDVWKAKGWRIWKPSVAEPAKTTETKEN